MSWKDETIGVSTPDELLTAVNNAIHDGYYLWKFRMNSIELVKDDGRYVTHDITVRMDDDASPDFTEAWQKAYRTFSQDATRIISRILINPRTGLSHWKPGPEFVQISTVNARPGDIAEYDIEEEGKTHHRAGKLSITLGDDGDEPEERVMGVNCWDLIEGDDNDLFVIQYGKPAPRIYNLRVWRSQQSTTYTETVTDQ